MTQPSDSDYLDAISYALWAAAPSQRVVSDRQTARNILDAIRPVIERDRRAAAEAATKQPGSLWAGVGWAVATVAAAVAIAAVVALSPAEAHPAGVPHDDGPLSQWFSKQWSRAGGYCCTDSDAYYLGDDDWTMAGQTYRVRLGEAWWDVPADAVRDPNRGGPNPTGQAILWFVQADGQPPVIWCFAPGETY